MNTMSKIGALVAGIFVMVSAVAIPVTAQAATSAPTCVFNTIVQPNNNGGTTLSWRVHNANTVHISGIGTVNDADSTVVFPNQLTVYTLTAVGNGGTTTCTAVAHPVAAYPHVGGQNNNFFTPGGEFCSMWVNPDYTLTGGTAILSWRATGADRVWIDRGIGNVSNEGTRVVPGTATPEMYTMTAEWPNGLVRTCSATVLPASGFAGSVFPPYAQQPVNYPYTTTPTPQPTYRTVSLSRVPYTGPNDALYVGFTAMTLLASIAGMWLLYVRSLRRRLA